MSGLKFPERRRGRVNLSLSARSQIKLKQMAISCNKKPATQGQLFIDHCLNSPAIIREFQERYNTNRAYWILPVTGLNGDYENRAYVIGNPAQPPKK